MNCAHSAHNALTLRSFGVAFGDQIILSDVSFELPERGLTVLVGPAGGGKSTLLRTLAGLNDPHPSLVTWGTAEVDGSTMTFGAAARRDPRRPALVMQHARFFLDTVRENLVSTLPNRALLEQREQTRIIVSRLERDGLSELTHHLESNAVDLPLALQRRLSIARALMSEPRVLFADEPTAALDERDAADVLTMLQTEAKARSVLFVTHNQRLASAAGGTTLLLAGGRIQERASTRDFFERPSTEIVRHFVRTGGCNAPAPAASTERLETCVRPVAPQAATDAQSRFVGPRGFFWVIPGRLGGLPRPGIIDESARDLDGLSRLGVSVLVTLEEKRTVDPSSLLALGIRPVHFPVVDMGVPRVEDTLVLCQQMDEWMRGGDVVAVHCRAGLGRTGTVLACQLIFSGMAPHDALEAVRAIHPRCVQSNAQVEFLRSFADAVNACPTTFERMSEPPSQSRNRNDTWH